MRTLVVTSAPPARLCSRFSDVGQKSINNLNLNNSDWQNINSSAAYFIVRTDTSKSVEMTGMSKKMSTSLLYRCTVTRAEPDVMMVPGPCLSGVSAFPTFVLWSPSYLYVMPSILSATRLSEDAYRTQSFIVYFDRHRNSSFVFSTFRWCLVYAMLSQF